MGAAAGGSMELSAQAKKLGASVDQLVVQAREAGWKGSNPYELQQFLKDKVLVNGKLVPNAEFEASRAPQSKKTGAVAARVDAAPTAEGKLAIVKQEQQLLPENASKADQRQLLDAQLRLEHEVSKQDAAQEKIDSAQEIRDRQQADLDKQHALEDKVAKEHEKIGQEAEKQRKEQDKAYAEQQKALEAPPPFEPKQQNLANTSAQLASTMEAQPGTMQAQLNAMTAPKPAPEPAPGPAAPALPEPGAVPAKLPEPIMAGEAPAVVAPQPFVEVAAFGYSEPGILRQGKQALPEPVELPPISKEAVIKQAIATPDVDWQYTVQRPMVPGGKGFIQVDAIAGGENLTSSNLADLNKAGAKLPEVPDWVPQGQYMKKELEEIIAKGEPVQGKPHENTRKASARRQQRGAASVDTISSAAGAAVGGGYGFLTTKKEDGESDEHFQSRRLLRTLIFAGGGGLAGSSASKIFFRSGAAKKARSLRAIQHEAVGIDTVPEWYQKVRQSPKVVAIREYLNNSRARVKDTVGNAVQAGHEVPEGANPYAKGKTYGPKLAEGKRKALEAMDAIQERTIEAAKASPLGVEPFIARFNKWREALAAPDYNERVRHLYELDGKPVPPEAVFMTDDEAEAIYHQAKLDGLEGVFNDLNKDRELPKSATRDALSRDLITPETRALWEKQYPEYTPLNKVASDNDLDAAIMGHIGGGPGLSVLSSGVKKIKGSDLEISDLDGNLMANWEDAMTRAEKNEVMKSAGMFFKNMEFDGTPVPGVEVRTPQGMEHFDPNHMISYMVKGKPTWVIFKDPKLATAFSNLNAEQVSGLTRYIAKATRMFSRSVTGYNLDFLMNNPIRDRIDASVKSLSQGDVTGAIGQANPAKMLTDPAIVAQWIHGNKTPDTDLFQQMLDNGGMPGGYASSSREKARALIQSIREADTGKVKWTLEKTKKVFNFLNEISEGSTRFRAYKNALEKGATEQEAAIAALNSSIDFNMKGTHGLGALYAFFNPAQQGAVNMVKNNMRSKDAMVAIVTGLVGLNAAVDSWNSSFDPNWSRHKALAFSRTNGIPIIHGTDPKTGDLLYYTVPMAQGLRPIKAATDFAVELANGKITKDDNLADELSRVGGAFVNSVNPLGASPLDKGSVLSSTVSMVTPTIARPIVDVVTNRDYAGRPIVPDRLQNNQYIQNQAKRKLGTYDTNTGKMAIAISDMLKKHADIEASPEVIKSLVASYAGGPGRLVSNVANTGNPLTLERHASVDDLEQSSPLFKETERQLSEAKTTSELAHQQSALFFKNTLEKIPPERWGEFWSKADASGLLPKDPFFRMQLVDKMTDAIKGRGDVDKLVAQFSVENGERASYYASRKKDFKTEGAYLQYLREQAKKGLVTAPVIPQIKQYLDSQK
jgi:hypothetical protein